MHFGDLVSVLSDGIRVNAKELEPIGIYDGCTAWGVWVPDVRARSEDGQNAGPSHFVFSPIELSAWPVLVRVELKLDERKGSMADAMKVLQAQQLNILSIDAIPTGHCHATINIIGEALTIKHAEGDNVLQEASAWPTVERHFGNNDLWDYCCKRLAPAMLGYSMGLADALQDADEEAIRGGKQGFLRRAIFDGAVKHRALLYGYPDLPPDVQDAGRIEKTAAVQCTWLHELAFFWLYRDDLGPAIELSFDAKACKLMVVQTKVQAHFAKSVGNFLPPFKAIAAINAYEQYARITLSHADERRRTVSVVVPFRAQFGKNKLPSTLGLQSHLFEELARRHYDIRKVSIATREMTLDHEFSELSLLVSMPGGKEFDDATRNTLCDFVQSTIESFTGCDVKCVPPPHVRLLHARRVFLSTRYQWLKLPSPLYERIRAIAADYAFNLVDVREADRVQGFQIIPNESIADTARRLIKHCDAFLQIIPRPVADHMPWIHAEYAAACAFGLPAAICVDCASSTDPETDVGVDSWERSLPFARGKMFHPFYASHDPACRGRTVYASVRLALRRLSAATDDAVRGAAG